VAAVRAIRDVWDKNRTRTLAEVEIIDIKPRSELEQTWKAFFTREHYIMPNSFLKSYLCWHPRRSCEALAFATLQNDPWPDNWFPTFETLNDLHEWIEPLLQEEDHFETDERPFSRNGKPYQ